jgi:hypothetical protein
MSDETLRQLERRADEAPDDGAALEALDRAQARAGAPRLRDQLLARLAGAVERRRADVELLLRCRRALMFSAIYGRIYGVAHVPTRPPELVRHRTGNIVRLPAEELPPLHPSDAAAPPPPTLESAEALRARWEGQYRVVADLRARVQRIASTLDYVEVERRSLQALYHRLEAVFGMRTPDGASVRDIVEPDVLAAREAQPRYGSWMEEVEDLERQHGRVLEEDSRRAQAERAYRLDWPEPAPPDLPPTEPTPQQRARERTRANVRRRPPRRLR